MATLPGVVQQGPALLGFTAHAFFSPRMWGGADSLYPIGLMFVALGQVILLILSGESDMGFWAGLSVMSFGLGISLPVSLLLCFCSSSIYLLASCFVLSLDFMLTMLSVPRHFILSLVSG